MQLNDEQREILYRAWLLSHEGNGQVLEDWAHDDADELAEQGWLERRSEANGDLSWWWTPAAGAALGLGGMMQTARESVN